MNKIWNKGVLVLIFLGVVSVPLLIGSKRATELPHYSPLLVNGDFSADPYANGWTTASDSYTEFYWNSVVDYAYYNEATEQVNSPLNSESMPTTYSLKQKFTVPELTENWYIFDYTMDFAYNDSGYWIANLRGVDNHWAMWDKDDFEEAQTYKISDYEEDTVPLYITYLIDPEDIESEDFVEFDLHLSEEPADASADSLAYGYTDNHFARFHREADASGNK